MNMLLVGFSVNDELSECIDLLVVKKPSIGSDYIDDPTIVG